VGYHQDLRRLPRLRAFIQFVGEQAQAMQRRYGEFDSFGQRVLGAPKLSLERQRLLLHAFRVPHHDGSLICQDKPVRCALEQRVADRLLKSL